MFVLKKLLYYIRKKLPQVKKVEVGYFFCRQKLCRENEFAFAEMKIMKTKID